MEVTLFHERLLFTSLHGITPQMTYVKKPSLASQDLALLLSYVLVMNSMCSVNVNPNQLVFDSISGLFCTTCNLQRLDPTLPLSVHVGLCDVL
jgi:hypothetical protein